ncbi:hypothetical protein GCM10025865_00830 [Paraoerskovia sediminicola]|uniref:Helix-turn-helix domain-containing protein n=1 Tax=Paraoerskovia sediminicola TaxID=1138587 RepID=A0ABN6X7T9_9CELL|nr:hypothetical protein [Paraoerskovia sediminicola]BDZ40784.1 hypothetical protein GCM10025865_00830 [Paraoerskovia sediminicola]
MNTLTPADVAADLGLSTYTVSAHLRSGAIGGGFQVVPLGPWHIDAAEYAAWKARRIATPSDPERIEPRTTRSTAAHTRSKESAR